MSAPSKSPQIMSQYPPKTSRRQSSKEAVKPGWSSLSEVRLSRSIYADLLEQAGPGPIRLPAGEPLTERMPRPEAFRQIAPGKSRPQPPQHPVDYLPVVPSRTTPPVHTWQQRRYPLPHRIRQLTTTHHKIMIIYGQSPMNHR